MVDVLIFGAHPDDAEFGMGGTLCKLVREGKSVAVCVLTKGESGSHGTTEDRIKEMRDAAAFLGVELEMLDFIDCEIQDTPQARKTLASVIRKYQPTIIFAPWYNNPGSHLAGTAHPDHIATGHIVRAATRFARFKNIAGVTGEAHRVRHVLYYMLHSCDQPTVIVDVSNDMDMLKELAQKHASQLAIKDGQILEYLLETRKSRAPTMEYAEGFISPDPLPLNLTALLE